jgi:alpha-D-ribose 1-methylphosphonate 5-phosphate C-P lyase
MAATMKWYGKALLKALNKEVDFDTDTIKVALCTSSYTPNQDTHDYFDDITNELSTGNGYTAGGATLANKTIGYTDGTNVIKLDADDVTWANSTITARYAIVYVATGTI